MEINFYKYQGTGNDFVVIDNRDLSFPRENTDLVHFLCDRRFGVGADGLMLLNPSDQYDFTMVYYNADGSESTMCGNGGRCLVAFAHKLGIFKKETTFDAIDGLHYATYENGITNLQMIDVDAVEVYNNHCFLNTGSPHHVQMVHNIGEYDVKTNGAKIRYGAPYFDKGTNVNFVESLNNDKFRVRTYERGVENETLACGTGVTAVAIAMYEQKQTTNTKIPLKVEGGELEVSFEPTENGYKNVFLKGPATFVFNGNIKYHGEANR
ncbi:diaminopimelate epimerase [Wenyingzhuangia marina]|uniref:Diaminopimelate epimerase n=1 Tax=Wenyingzhuangia marina TaxID=1195760 RepID=A0A1M5VA42_9FLAO|nr:diaminopimelate epimerase [Wenyingzhuangia marina]GGF73471.1 diaminopimelate epimerase [Wenyingzhuangia marina]SHH71964.1 diaminopimelate epimerase [Wenyingzhuangia marina]